MPADPVAEPLDLPPEYGSPEVTLAWESVRARLAARLSEQSKREYGYGPSPATTRRPASGAYGPSAC